MKKIKLAIIEDIEEVRKNIESYFCAQEEIESVLSADSMEAFFHKTAEERYMPDVVLSDIGLPGMDGIEGIARIKSEMPDTNIIMLTVFHDNERIFRSLRAGAVGYLLKGDPKPDIKRAVLEVWSGGSSMSPAIARKVIQHFMPAKNGCQEVFSDKEKQVINGLTEGLSYKLIADQMGVTINSVRFHIKGIYRKLHVNSKAEVISKVYKGEI